MPRQKMYQMVLILVKLQEPSKNQFRCLNLVQDTSVRNPIIRLNQQKLKRQLVRHLNLVRSACVKNPITRPRQEPWKSPFQRQNLIRTACVKNRKRSSLKIQKLVFRNGAKRCSTRNSRMILLMKNISQMKMS
ncbi:uncharacterized protein LOC113465334 isoform X2 [Diaphorina citri]|uniref:Uncharacterized protein LOC113465334 isoform X2 n=1 Tax=Diaphorina citri TaxID=121845 RepID=A0A3Q0IUP2_DIACI|nr:uncharacterized protein LOC113465334 isoform X2 [Diaphorina citri]